MPIEFDITLTEKDMYRFNMYQLYSGFQGWFSVIAAALAFAAAAVTFGETGTRNTVIYIVCGVILAGYLPLSMNLRAKQRFKTTEELRKPLHYSVGDDGIRVSQGEASGELLWDQVYKLAATKSNVLIYSNRINAYVIPREQLGDRYQALAALAKKQLPKYRIKMK